MATQKKTATKPAASKTLAKTQPKTLATASTGKIDLMEDEGQGQENFRPEDLQIPRLSLVQSNSPQVTKGTPEYNKEISVGEILDSVSGTAFDGEKGVRIIPISYARKYLEWKLRTAGGGFVKDHGLDEDVLRSAVKNSEGKLMLSKTTNLVITCEYFVFLVKEDGSYSPYVISMSSTQLKKARNWNTMINALKVPRTDGQPGTFCPAMFYRSYDLTTVPESNDKGNWMGWKIVAGPDVLSLPDGEAMYIAARNFRKSIMEGAVRASAPTAAHAPEEPEDASSPM